MALRKQKSRKQQVAELAVDYLKIKTATKAAKGASKGARKAAKGTAVYPVAKRTPVVRRIPIIVGARVAAAVVAVKLRSTGDESPAPAGP